MGPDLRTVQADIIIYAVGQRPLSDEALPSGLCARYMIGDCNIGKYRRRYERSVYRKRHRPLEKGLDAAIVLRAKIRSISGKLLYTECRKKNRD